MTNEYQHYLDLFQECLSKKYQHSFEGGSYTYEITKDTDWVTLNIWLEWSNGMADWFSNLDFPQTSIQRHQKWLGKYIEVFLESGNLLNLIWQTLFCKKDINRIQIVGYSHGAALAMLCHEYCIFNRPDCIVEGYGFGYSTYFKKIKK